MCSPPGCCRGGGDAACWPCVLGANRLEREREREKKIIITPSADAGRGVWVWPLRAAKDAGQRPVQFCGGGAPKTGSAEKCLREGCSLALRPSWDFPTAAATTLLGTPAPSASRSLCSFGSGAKKIKGQGNPRPRRQLSAFPRPFENRTARSASGMCVGFPRKQKIK